MSLTAQGMTIDQLKTLLKDDPVARQKFIGATIEYYENLGVKVTDAMLKNFDEDTLQAVASGKAGAGTNTNVNVFAA
jgi:nucleoside diphosphate kinase